MNAFVLSGGANLGSIQAGMMEALFEAGIVPDVLVGTSIGAANAAFVAADPSLERASKLSDVWRNVRARDIFPINPVRSARALLGHGTLFSAGPFRRLLEKHLPYRNIEDAAVPLRIVATRFADGSEIVFDRGPVVDAILASTALPGVFPPHEVEGVVYLDGGLSNQVPLLPAIEAGAEALYVLSVGFPCPPPPNARTPRSVLMHSLGILLSQRVRSDTNHLPMHHPDVRVVQIPPVCTETGLRDFSRVAELIERGRIQTANFLKGEECLPCPHRAPHESSVSSAGSSGKAKRPRANA